MKTYFLFFLILALNPRIYADDIPSPDIERIVLPDANLELVYEMMAAQEKKLTGIAHPEGATTFRKIQRQYHFHESKSLPGKKENALICDRLLFDKNKNAGPISKHMCWLVSALWTKLPKADADLMKIPETNSTRM